MPLCRRPELSTGRPDDDTEPVHVSAAEVKKEIGNDFTAAQSLTKDITQQMFTELTKGADVHTPTITPEMISAAVTQSAAGMDGVHPLCSCKGYPTHLILSDFSCPNMKQTHRFNSLST